LGLSDNSIAGPPLKYALRWFVPRGYPMSDRVAMPVLQGVSYEFSEMNGAAIGRWSDTDRSKGGLIEAKAPIAIITKPGCTNGRPKTVDLLGNSDRPLRLLCRE
jgi:hypothetical protein